MEKGVIIIVLSQQVSSSGLDCIYTSTSQSSRVYCLNALLDDAMFGSTVLARQEVAWPAL